MSMVLYTAANLLSGADSCSDSLEDRESDFSTSASLASRCLCNLRLSLSLDLGLARGLGLVRFLSVYRASELESRRLGLGRRDHSGNLIPLGYFILAKSCLATLTPNCVVRHCIPSTLAAWPKPPQAKHTIIALTLPRLTAIALMSLLNPLSESSSSELSSS